MCGALSLLLYLCDLEEQRSWGGGGGYKFVIWGVQATKVGVPFLMGEVDPSKHLVH